MLSSPASAEGSRPVRSLLEMRRKNVVIQKWDLSCGAAALDILLRYKHGHPVTDSEVTRGLI
jgi:predicted double-glycine peptidase